MHERALWHGVKRATEGPHPVQRLEASTRNWLLMTGGWPGKQTCAPGEFIQTLFLLKNGSFTGLCWHNTQTLQAIEKQTNKKKWEFPVTWNVESDIISIPRSIDLPSLSKWCKPKKRSHGEMLLRPITIEECTGASRSAAAVPGTQAGSLCVPLGAALRLYAEGLLVYWGGAASS